MRCAGDCDIIICGIEANTHAAGQVCWCRLKIFQLVVDVDEYGGGLTEGRR